MPTPKHSGPDATLRVRLVGALVIAGLLGLNGLGLAGLVWCVVVAAAALSVNWAARRASEQDNTTDFQRLGSALSVGIEALVWSAPAVLFWGHSDPALRLVALSLLFLQIYFAAGFAYREWVSLVICGLPPVLVLLALVSLDGRAGLAAKLTTILVTVGAIGFALILARINARMLEGISQQERRPLSP